MRNRIVKHFALSTAALLSISMNPLTVHASDSFVSPVNLTEEEVQWVNDTYQKGETVRTEDGQFSYKIVRDPHVCGHIIEYIGNGGDIAFPDYTGLVRLNRSSVDLSERDDITSVTYDGVRHPGEMLDDFHNCKNLKSLTVNAEYSDQLIELYDLSDDFVKTPSGQCLLNGSFADCTNLKTIVLPHESEKLECYIGEKVFEGCTALKELDLSGCWGIKEDAFLNCTALEKVVFNENVKEIQEHAFGYIKDADGNYQRCDGLTIYGVTGTAAETYAKENGIPFVAGTAAENNSAELERAYTLLKQYAASLPDGLHADVMLGQDCDPPELWDGKVVLYYSAAHDRDLRPMFRDFMLENGIDPSLVITVKTDEALEFELSYELDRAYNRLTEFVAKQVEKGNDIFKGVKVISASGDHPDKVIVLDTDGTNRAEIWAQTRAFMKEREIGDDLVWIQYFDSTDGAASGDATCNNVVDVSDAVLAAKFATGDSKAVITDQGKLNADLDGDGSVTLDDVTLILKKITKQN